MQTIKRHWKLFTIAFIYVTIEATVRSTSLIMEYQGRGDPLEIWKPFVWEYSSTWVAVLMVPFIMMFDERYRISSEQWRSKYNIKRRCRISSFTKV